MHAHKRAHTLKHRALRLCCVCTFDRHVDKARSSIQGLSLCSDRKQHLTVTTHKHISPWSKLTGDCQIVRTLNLSKTLLLLLYFQICLLAFSSKNEFCTSWYLLYDQMLTPHEGRGGVRFESSLVEHSSLKKPKHWLRYRIGCASGPSTSQRGLGQGESIPSHYISTSKQQRSTSH